MKKRLTKSLCVIIALLSIIMVLPFTVSAASDFKVENGVLLEYTGSSKSVTIPSTVNRIADSAFYGNKNIQSVDLSGVSVIGNDAFRNCVNLKTVSGYDNVSSCGAYAFYGTAFLTDYTATDLVMGSVLVSSKAKGSYIVPSNVRSIAPYAFSKNTDITSVTIGDGVMSVGEGAFWNCTALKTVTVSSQVSYIGALAFEGTAFLTSNTKEFFVLGNGILVDYAGSATAVTVPNTVKQIGAGAFYNNTKITSVTIPASVSGIGMRAFAGCTALKSVALPSNLTLIDKEAFSTCKAITSIEIPASVSVIGESAFISCEKLKTVKYFTSADISRGMFANCKGLTSFMMASKPKKIGDYAFYNCSSLSEMSMADSVTSISASAFTGATKVSVWCDSASFAWNDLALRGVKVYQIGDANLDSKVNVKDATQIQKATAGMVTLDFSATLRSDVDFNAVVNVRDATWVQKKLAGIL